ncbi:MAG: tryptophan--tRNA ligase [Myxococcota bacterium]|nr:tryptophan--tRNA ligase [Myxococcota bacterium]
MVDTQRSLTGIKPTGLVHWGHYFGMIKPALELTQAMDAYYFIADLHALTSVRDATALRHDSYVIAATWIAAGLDPESAVLWRQSDVPEVAELAWILSCVTGFGLIERAHSLKDARAKGREVNFGVVSYPVLMAADILLYDTDVVPVGKDQAQHLEMTRDMAGYFNQQFLGQSCYDESGHWNGEGLKDPRAVIQDASGTVVGIDGRKMSSSYDNGIPIFGRPKQLRKRVMTIVTDSTPLEAPKDPTTCHVFTLFKLFANETEQAELAAQYRAGHFGYGHAKQALYDKSAEVFQPMQARFDELMSDTDALEALLQRGAERARDVGLPVLNRVRRAVGLPVR